MVRFIALTEVFHLVLITEVALFASAFVSLRSRRCVPFLLFFFFFLLSPFHLSVSFLLSLDGGHQPEILRLQGYIWLRFRVL